MMRKVITGLVGALVLGTAAQAVDFIFFDVGGGAGISPLQSVLPGLSVYPAVLPSPMVEQDRPAGVRMNGDGVIRNEQTFEVITTDDIQLRLDTLFSEENLPLIAPDDGSGE